jgi:hypothetical protein
MRQLGRTPFAFSLDLSGFACAVRDIGEEVDINGANRRKLEGAAENIPAEKEAPVTVPQSIRVKY